MPDLPSRAEADLQRKRQASGQPKGLPPEAEGGAPLAGGGGGNRLFSPTRQDTRRPPEHSCARSFGFGLTNAFSRLISDSLVDT
ncbi:hypothetical protein AVEN_63707-1 [Araneus ventricosus]|uniref:Uncharacterized protein n=1 Tax=Araneus ventricosus TaxID=182803 RepID=A0A4Y2S619_ARAVE|nr:hypothetical protein AVEN_63707-1 [Araneus ventricosus]